MSKNGFLKTVVFLALLTGVSTGAFAQLTISGGFAVSTMDASPDVPNFDVSGGMSYGGNVYFDYLLPINIPLSLGFEVGADWAYLNFDYTGDPNLGGRTVFDTDVVTAVPLLLRAAYHLDLFSKLDFYFVGKIGYALGIITEGSGGVSHIGDSNSVGGIAFGFDIGVAYYFASAFGIFIEGGFDDYALQATFLDDDNEDPINIPFYRFVTAGISLRW
jgi:hypothetical protein